MTIRVGLMGFGRIGRNLFRILLDREDIDIAVISDIADHDGLEYLLRYDTILDAFPMRSASKMVICSRWVNKSSCSTPEILAK